MRGSEREGLTVNDALRELLLMIDAAKHASAHRIVAVTPWDRYSRQDKKSAPREPISARLVADALESAGIHGLVTMDLHAGQVQGFFPKPVDHMTAMPILTQFVIDRLGDQELVIIAPSTPDARSPSASSRRRSAPPTRSWRRSAWCSRVADIVDVIGDVKGQDRRHRGRHHRHGRHPERGCPQMVLDQGVSEAACSWSRPTGLFSARAFEILEKPPCRPASS